MEKISVEELKWRRRNDARTLAEADMIRNDKNRYREAIIGAKEIAKEWLDEVKSIVKVAKVKVPNMEKENKEYTFTGRGRNDNPATVGKLI